MEFITSLNGPALYLVIFCAKIIEVTLMTLRMVYINKGEKLIGSTIGFFEVFIWLLVVSSVLNNITEDPMKIVIYCLAFAMGNYIGVTIENKLAVGLSSIQAIVPDEIGEKIADKLRENNFGVTLAEAKGREELKKDILLVMLKRKRISEAVSIINEMSNEALITVNDVKTLSGGYIKK